MILYSWNWPKHALFPILRFGYAVLGTVCAAIVIDRRIFVVNLNNADPCTLLVCAQCTFFMNHSSSLGRQWLWFSVIIILFVPISVRSDTNTSIGHCHRHRHRQRQHRQQSTPMSLCTVRTGKFSKFSFSRFPSSIRFVFLGFSLYLVLECLSLLCPSAGNIFIERIHTYAIAHETTLRDAHTASDHLLNVTKIEQTDTSTHPLTHSHTHTHHAAVSPYSRHRRSNTNE